MPVVDAVDPAAKPFDNFSALLHIHISSSQSRSASSSLQCSGRAGNFTEHLLRQAVPQKYLDSAASICQWSSSPSEVEIPVEGTPVDCDCCVAVSVLLRTYSTTTDHARSCLEMSSVLSCPAWLGLSTAGGNIFQPAVPLPAQRRAASPLHPAMVAIALRRSSGLNGNGDCLDDDDDEHHGGSSNSRHGCLPPLSRGAMS